MSKLSEWYNVTFNGTYIYRDVRPPGGVAWKDHFEWNDIIRVCFQTGDLYSSDELYIFETGRKESYLIPMEADGGLELWGEIIDRGFFDAELAIKIATVSEQGLYCWPEITDEDVNSFSEKKYNSNISK